jgi:hypothetical protein
VNHAWDIARSDRRDQRVDVIAAEKAGQERHLRLAVQEVLIDAGPLAHGGSLPTDGAGDQHRAGQLAPVDD